MHISKLSAADHDELSLLGIFEELESEGEKQLTLTYIGQQIERQSEALFCVSESISKFADRMGDLFNQKVFCGKSEDIPAYFTIALARMESEGLEIERNLELLSKIYQILLEIETVEW